MLRTILRRPQGLTRASARRRLRLIWSPVWGAVLLLTVYVASLALPAFAFNRFQQVHGSCRTPSGRFGNATRSSYIAYRATVWSFYGPVASNVPTIGSFPEIEAVTPPADVRMVFVWNLGLLGDGIRGYSYNSFERGQFTPSPATAQWAVLWKPGTPYSVWVPLRPRAPLLLDWILCSAVAFCGGELRMALMVRLRARRVNPTGEREASSPVSTCRTCGYAVSASTAICPECGKNPRARKKLYSRRLIAACIAAHVSAPIASAYLVAAPVHYPKEAVLAVWLGWILAAASAGVVPMFALVTTLPERMHVVWRAILAIEMSLASMGAVFLCTMFLRASLAEG